ncbi:MAG: glycosyltransferase family 39 protein [Oligoflexia bacterium]|nr:glycosyltransferase family 39 protein [Oligoflexia bacterium]MBF0364944.1 glycosyltransferase family 39 protein [Oligoflexia bacterium]
MSYRSATGALIAIAFTLFPWWAKGAGWTFDYQHHIRYGELLYQYYASAFTDLSFLDFTNARYYGGLLDLSAHLLYKLLYLLGWQQLEFFIFKNIYISLFGATALAVAALTAKEIYGNRAAFYTALFLLISPKFVGHSFNNPKDIAFACGYIIGVYALVRVVKTLPQLSWSLLVILGLGIGISLGMRIGGLLLVAYLGMIVTLWSIFHFKSFNEHKIKIITSLILALGLGYALCFLFWPLTHQRPIGAFQETLALMSSFDWPGTVLFKGKIVEGRALPWSYLPTWIAISTPPLILFGYLLSLGMLVKKQYQTSLNLFCHFTTLFPAFYVLAKKSTLYDDYRQMLFIYLPLVIVAAGAYAFWMEKIRAHHRLLSHALIVVLAMPSLLWMVKNYPNTYSYFNDLSGGIKSNAARFESDYWCNCYREIAEWMVKNKELLLADKRTIHLKFEGNPDSLTYFLAKDSKFHYKLVREEAAPLQEYGVVYRRGKSSEQLSLGWPHHPIVYAVTVDGVPICALIRAQ